MCSSRTPVYWQLGNLSKASWVLQSNEEVVMYHWFVYQNVQSSCSSVIIGVVTPAIACANLQARAGDDLPMVAMTFGRM
jgi:hypothetical protein